MTENLIKDHLQPEAMGLVQQDIKIPVGSKNGIDSAIVRYVVPKIFKGRLKKRREPDAIDAQIRDGL